jgi:hypothetical protein
MRLVLTDVPGLLVEIEILKALWLMFQVPNGVEVALAARCSYLAVEGMIFNI